MLNPRTQKALTLTLAWLKAVGIPAAAGAAEINPRGDIVITTKAGQEIGVVLQPPGAAAVAAGDSQVVISSRDMTAKPAKAIRTFHRITTASGYGQPMPLNRGEAPTQRLKSGEDFDLTAIRHWEFRRTTNTSAAELGRYEDIITSEIRRFRYFNKGFCDRYGLEIDDLRTYGLAWGMNYIGLYEDHSKGKDDNRRLMRTHLRQRLHELQVMLMNRGRKVFADEEVVEVMTQGTVSDGNRQTGKAAALVSFIESEDVLEPDFEEGASLVDIVLAKQKRQAGSKLDLTSAETRAASAKKLLLDGLQALSHDEFLRVLGEAGANSHLEEDARREAQRQLRLHCRGGGCQPCYWKYRLESLPRFQFHSKKVVIDKVLDDKLQVLAQQRLLAFVAKGGKTCPKCLVQKQDFQDFKLFYDFTWHEKQGLRLANMKLQSYCNACRHVPKKGA